MPTLQCYRGEAATFDRRVKDTLTGLFYGPTPAPDVAGPSPFDPSDALAAVVWLGDYSDPMFAPAVSWLDATLGTYRVSVAGSDTAPFPSGGYAMRLTVTRGGVTSDFAQYRLSVNPAPKPAGSPPVWVDPSAGDIFSGLPCTDADVAARIPKDYGLVVDNGLYVSEGKDGVVADGSFVLTSAEPFAYHGVQAGMVCVLDTGGRMTKDVLGVTAAADGALTLGRLGLAAGSGAFPGKPGGSTGVKFFVPTVVEEIKSQASDAERELGVAGVTDVVRASDLKNLVVLKVIAALYLQKQTQSSGDVYKDKYTEYSARAKTMLAELAASYSENEPAPDVPVAGEPAADPSWAWRQPSAGLWPWGRGGGGSGAYPWRGGCG